MSYRYDRDKKRRGRLYLLGIVFLVLVFFTGALSSVFDFFERPLARAWERSNQNIEELSNVFQRLYAKEEIIKENELLRDRISLLEVDILRTEYLQKVLESYDQIENLAGTNEIIPAEILVRSPRTPRDTLIINRGSQHGVVQGDTVVALDQVYIGNVVEVFDVTSKVSLLTASGTVIPSVLYPHAESFDLLGHGSSYRAELSRDSQVAIDDVVYSQEDPGRIIAIVREIIFDPRDPFKEVFFSAPVNVKDVQVLGVIKK